VRTLSGIKILPNRKIDRTVLDSKYGAVTGDLASIGKEAGATVINPMDWLCDDRFCMGAKGDGNIMYKDGYHLNATFVRNHVDFLDSIVLDEVSSPSSAGNR
jgi:hypothetical protein